MDRGDRLDASLDVRPLRPPGARRPEAYLRGVGEHTRHRPEGVQPRAAVRGRAAGQYPPDRRADQLVDGGDRADEGHRARGGAGVDGAQPGAGGQLDPPSSGDFARTVAPGGQRAGKSCDLMIHDFFCPFARRGGEAGMAPPTIPPRLALFREILPLRDRESSRAIRGASGGRFTRPQRAFTRNFLSAY